MSHPHSPSTTTPNRGWWHRLVDWMMYKDKNKWLEDMKGNLSLMVSIIATITFQSALNPPGGLVSANFKENLNCSDVSPCPGQAVLAVVYPLHYNIFLACNTICFIASLSVCLLLVSGLNMNHAFTTWLFLLSMWITITSLTLTYLFGASMVTPLVLDVTASTFGMAILVWIALLAVVGALLLIRIVAWGVRCIKSCNRSSATSTIN